MTLFADLPAVSWGSFPPGNSNDWREKFSPSMHEKDVSRVVEEIASDWAANNGHFDDACKVASLMPDPAGWFNRNVKVPAYPRALVENIEGVLDEYMLDFPKDDGCCGEIPRGSWSYCPICGDEFESQTVQSIFNSHLHTAVNAYRQALDSLMLAKKEKKS